MASGYFDSYKRKKKVRQPGFWAMVGRGWRKFKAFLGSELWYCPHGWDRFCPKCRRWRVRQMAQKAGLQEIVKARKGKSVQPIFDDIYEEMEAEDLEVLREMRDMASLPESSEDVEPSEPQSRPETERRTEACPGCKDPDKIVGECCILCGHVTGQDIPYDVPEAKEHP